jgi:nicotinate-nucleotide pyrophosphorylase
METTVRYPVFPAEQRGKAQLIIKESGVFVGGALAAYLFKYIDATATVKHSIEDGALVEKGTRSFNR